MKVLASTILALLSTAVTFAGGTAYYTTARVTITGPSDWGSVANSVTTSNSYTVAASTSLTLTAFTYNNVGTATILNTTCPTDLLPTGQSCDIVVGFRPPDEHGAYGYLELQVEGNTRQQAPGRVTVVVPVTDN